MDGLFKNVSDFLLRVYIKKLERELMKGRMPKHIMIVADENFLNRLQEFVRWCKKFGVEELTVCVRRGEKKVETSLLNGVKVNYVIGYSGKDEIVDAVRELARLVDKGVLKAEDVDEKVVERFLKIRSSPDLIINVGDEIPEFLIWQSIYSELYFADISQFRYVDFLRCLRDYQRRERRYGR
ncbi:Di-trans-poly-cis-decaprenylcistransferase [Archaeoglobus profundus DSM 5631]|uniref:Di-trans-poly-cis-decaprenylcistransferase n=1 Tax=Archaeoglobus profundus (strain DSM 5631 / JCM 9629 / NBRC 100127 / Av18) TaxID=572546 RepID=D2RGA5_ARCPA|nr:Di-trans-poly-cis-decaprenylcistransferase [Archaeoglobus profundus DSM 5631]